MNTTQHLIISYTSLHNDSTTTLHYQIKHIQTMHQLISSTSHEHLIITSTTSTSSSFNQVFHKRIKHSNHVKSHTQQPTHFSSILLNHIIMHIRPITSYWNLNQHFNKVRLFSPKLEFHA